MPKKNKKLSVKEMADSLKSIGNSSLSPSLSSSGEGLMELSVDQLRENPFNPRRFYSEDRLKEMADSLLSDGLLVPLLVAKKGGSFFIIEGHYRMKAAQLAGLKSLRCEVISGDNLSDVDFFMKGFVSNNVRNEQSVFDDALVFSFLISEGVFSSQVELANHIKRSKSYVSKVLKLSFMPLEVIKTLNESVQNVTVHTAYSFYCLYEKLGESEEFLDIVGSFSKGEISQQCVDRALKNISKSKDGSKSSLDTHYPSKRFIEVDGKNVGHFVASKSGLTIKINIKSNILAEKIESVIRETIVSDFSGELESSQDMEIK